MSLKQFSMCKNNKQALCLWRDIEMNEENMNNITFKDYQSPYGFTNFVHFSILYKNRNLADYREKYSDWEIKKNENNDDYDAYIENLRDKTRTSKVHYYIWLLLATLFTITVIRQIKK